MPAPLIACCYCATLFSFSTPANPFQAEYDAAKAAFEEDKKKAKKGTPAKERLSDIHGE